MGSRFWLVLPLDAMVGIMLIGLVHWFYLRPLLHPRRALPGRHAAQVVASLLLALSAGDIAFDR